MLLSGRREERQTGAESARAASLADGPPPVKHSPGKPDAADAELFTAFSVKALPDMAQLASVAPMDGDRVRQALARIEAASHRIEAVAARPTATAPGDPDLERRHANLRSETGAALRELDRLIESLES